MLESLEKMLKNISKHPKFKKIVTSVMCKRYCPMWFDEKNLTKKIASRTLQVIPYFSRQISAGLETDVVKLQSCLNLEKIINWRPFIAFEGYGWFFQNLGKEAVRTFMHTTVLHAIYQRINMNQKYKKYKVVPPSLPYQINI